MPSLTLSNCKLNHKNIPAQNGNIVILPCGHVAFAELPTQFLDVIRF